MLWAITSYFNPAGYRTRLENYRRFRAHLTVPLVTVEASFDGRFELGPADADILVQRHARDVLWQKERLLNVALGFLPAECDRVAWLDCDVVFAADDWPKRACAALTTHSLVQLSPSAAIWTERRPRTHRGGGTPTRSSRPSPARSPRAGQSPTTFPIPRLRSWGGPRLVWHGRPAASRSGVAVSTTHAFSGAAIERSSVQPRENSTMA
jgi:hypothetical protein